MKKLSVRWYSKVAILSAVATILMLFEFPLPFIAPDWYKLDFSEVAVLIGGFALGPLAALAIEAIKIVLNFFINGTITMGVGELANLLIGLSFVLPSSFIYHHKKSFKNAIIGLVVGVFSMAVMGGLLNAYVMLPVYAFAMSTPEYTLTVADFVAYGTAITPAITNLFTFILYAVIPFNLLKGVLVSIFVLLIYKRVSIFLHDKIPNGDEFHE